MAEKISTLIIKVDLDCERCYKKIRTVLCKLQDKEKITAISYDEKNKTVIISGPFDPQKLSKKLRCKAGKVIKEIQIKDTKEKEKEKGKEAEKDKAKDKPAAEKEKPKETKEEDKPAAEKEKPKETKEEDKPKDKPTESKSKPAEKDPPKEKPPQSTPAVPAPQIPVWPAGPACCYRPIYVGYYGGGRCCTCGRACEWMGPGPMGFYGGGPYDGYKGSQFFCEEDPSSSWCRIM